MNNEENINDSIEKLSNYSIVDGSMNCNINRNSFTIEKAKDSYCGKCGNKMDIKNIYCNYCGENLEKVKHKKISIKSNNVKDFNYKDILSSFNLRKCFMTSLLSLVVLLIFSFIIKITLIGSSGQVGELINPLHILLFSNLGTLDVFVSSMMNSSSVSNINLGLFILLILPVISLIIGYKVCLKNDNISMGNHIKNSIAVGVIYTFILCILAKISQTQLNLSSGFGEYGYSVNYGFTISSILIKGFLIGFISILLIGLKKEYVKDNLYIGILKIVPKVLGMGYILTLVILVIIYLSKVNYLGQMGLTSYINQSNIVVVLSQLGIYMWAFANLIPINIGNGSLSINTLIGSNASFDVLLILGALIAISALIFIILGCKLESKYKNQGIKPVLIFSILYAVAMGIVGLFTILYVSEDITSITSILTSINMGFNIIIGMIASFVYSFTMTLIGFKLNIFN
ncbi:MAG: hypothetical protein RSG52_03270 [Terrisporobacter sp.]|uniref:hypothetical protein n=1 Tax=Terrisporobacter sp. TaxID=1965305 RepID=UPI002FCBC01A